MKSVSVKTNQEKEFIEITKEVQKQIPENFEGAVLVSTSHTTAAITINENADPDVQSDMIKKFKEISSDSRYKHFEGNSDSHVLSSLVGSSEIVPINEGELVLGRWQGIYFCEFDGPRERKVNLTFLRT
ncbi:MAG: secondary thiamine-phosphate synthase enzyme YjbQ [Nanoarchaeota archaeon]